MIPCVSQAFVSMAVDPLLLRIERWMKTGPIGSVAYAHAVLAFGRAVSLGLVFLGLWQLEVPVATWLVEHRVATVVAIVLVYYAFVINPVLLSKQTYEVSAGTRSVLHPLLAISADRCRKSDRSVFFHLVFVAACIPYAAVLVVVLGSFAGALPCVLALMGESLVSAFEGAIWQKPRVRGLVVASLPE